MQPTKPSNTKRELTEGDDASTSTVSAKRTKTNDDVVQLLNDLDELMALVQNTDKKQATEDNLKLMIKLVSPKMLDLLDSYVMFRLTETKINLALKALDHLCKKKELAIIITARSSLVKAIMNLITLKNPEYVDKAISVVLESFSHKDEVVFKPWFTVIRSHTIYMDTFCTILKGYQLSMKRERVLSVVCRMILQAHGLMNCAEFSEFFVRGDLIYSILRAFRNTVYNDVQIKDLRVTDADYVEFYDVQILLTQYGDKSLAAYGRSRKVVLSLMEHLLQAIAIKESLSNINDAIVKVINCIQKVFEIFHFPIKWFALKFLIINWYKLAITKPPDAPTLMLETKLYLLVTEIMANSNYGKLKFCLKQVEDFVVLKLMKKIDTDLSNTNSIILCKKKINAIKINPY